MRVDGEHDVTAAPAIAAIWSAAGNVLLAAEMHGAVTAIESAANIVYAGPGVQVALLGVEGLIVVQTPDGILVADRSRADEIKKVVDHLPEQLR